jgi:hypothetical protein
MNSAAVDFCAAVGGTLVACATGESSQVMSVVRTQGVANLARRSGTKGRTTRAIEQPAAAVDRCAKSSPTSSMLLELE